MATASISIFSAGTAILNTIVRLIPIGLYTGSGMSGLIFDDFRGTILFIGFLVNEAISYGYRMIFRGIYNPQCALMKTEEDYFVLPSPITQTFGFFFGFMMAEMYSQDTFLPWRFFVMTTIMMLVIYSRINVGCKSFLDALYCALLGILLGVGYFNIIKDYYKASIYKVSSLTDTASDFFKLDTTN